MAQAQRDLHEESLIAARRCYVVAATPRTGSSLLCEGLSATGIAGRPIEAFAPDFREPWYERWGLRRGTSFSEYLDAALKFGTTPNGVYGTKIQWMHVGLLASDVGYSGSPENVLESLFPEAVYVNVVRQDRRAQAISWFRACSTNEWFRTAAAVQPPDPPVLDIERVRYLERHIDWQQSSWQKYFSDRCIRPLSVEYEHLSTSYRGEVGRVLAFLGLDESAAKGIPEPTLVRQADDTTQAWRKQLDAEATFVGCNG
jgi:LPS sulfotransferase NodH